MGKRQRSDTDADRVTGKRISNGYGKPYGVMASPAMSISSQSDNEADIVWGHSPPPLNLKLCSTPGPKTRRRSDYSNRDIADMIECINTKNSSQIQSPGASTPPLLGLWMQDRSTNVHQSTPLHGRGGQRTSRRSATRKPPGDSWASLAKDLHMLAELSQTSRVQPPAAHQDEPREAGEHNPHLGDSDEDELVLASALAPIPDDTQNMTTPERGKPIPPAFRESPMDGIWEDDSWFENESFMTIATQLEEQACEPANEGQFVPVGRTGEGRMNGSISGNGASSSKSPVERKSSAQDHQFLCPPKVNRTFKSPAKPQAPRLNGGVLPSAQKETSKSCEFVRKLDKTYCGSNQPQGTTKYGIPGLPSSDQTGGVGDPKIGIPTSERQSRGVPMVLSSTINSQFGNSQFSRGGSCSKLDVVKPIIQSMKADASSMSCVVSSTSRKGQMGQFVCSNSEVPAPNNSGIMGSGTFQSESGTSLSLKVSCPTKTVKSQFCKAGRSNGALETINNGVNAPKKSPSKPPSTFVGGSQFRKAGRGSSVSSSDKISSVTLNSVPGSNDIGTLSSRKMSPKRIFQSGIAAPSSGQFHKTTPRHAPHISNNRSSTANQHNMLKPGVEVDKDERSPATPDDPNGSMELFNSSLGEEAAGKSLTPQKDSPDKGFPKRESNQLKEDDGLQKPKSESRRVSDLFSESSFIDEELLAAVELEEQNWELACSQRLQESAKVSPEANPTSAHGIGGGTVNQFSTNSLKDPCDTSSRKLASTTEHEKSVLNNQSNTKCPQFKAPLAQFSFPLKDKGPTSRNNVSQFGRAQGNTSSSVVPGGPLKNHNISRPLVGSSSHSPIKSAPPQIPTIPARANFQAIEKHVPAKNRFQANEESIPKNVPDALQNKRATFQFSGGQFKQGKDAPPKPTCTSQFAGPSVSKEPAATGIHTKSTTSIPGQFQFKLNPARGHQEAAPASTSNSVDPQNSYCSQSSSQFSAGSQMKTMDDTTWTEVTPSPVFAANGQPAVSHRNSIPCVTTRTVPRRNDIVSNDCVWPSQEGSKKVAEVRPKDPPPQFTRASKRSPDQFMKATVVGKRQSASPVTNKHPRTLSNERSSPAILGNKDSRRSSDDYVAPSQEVPNICRVLPRKTGISQFAKVPKLSPEQCQNVTVWQDSSSPHCSAKTKERSPQLNSNALRTLSGSINRQPSSQFSRTPKKASPEQNDRGGNLRHLQREHPTAATISACTGDRDDGRITCSQEQIERKRQEALARKKQKENLLGSHRMSLRNRTMKKS